jgi:uncharacterized alpha-E superfamily protein
MISRVAECCFWMNRYVERLENMARLLRVNRAYMLDTDLEVFERWYPLIVVSGEQKRFSKLFDSTAWDDTEEVQSYLTWDERCPVSVVNSARWARENARMTREVTSLEMWEALNAFWVWLGGSSAKKLFHTDRDTFYRRVKETADLFYGLSHSTMLHEEPFDFMRLGMLLERASQTARILDVKHHTLGSSRGKRETAVELAQWSVLLESCAAADLFVKRTHESLSGVAVARFLLLEEVFPRSVLHCLDRSWNFLRRVRPPRKSVGERSAEALQALLKRVRSRSIEEILDEGIHNELTLIIDQTAGVCQAIHDDYFNPTQPLHAA